MGHGSAWVGLVLLLAATGLPLAQADGHFLYATMNWERVSSDSYDVMFTIRSSWMRSYEGWPSLLNLSAPILLRGFKTPTLTVMGDNLNATSTFLDFRMEDMRQSSEPYGDWMEGLTTFTQSFPGPGKYTAEFTGCCVAGRPGEVDWNIGSSVEIMDDEMGFAPRLLVLPEVYVAPGGHFTVPAIHPDGTPSAAQYRWSIPIERPGVVGYSPAAGFSVAADTGIVTVAGNVQHGTYHVYVEVAVLHFEGEGCESGCVSDSVSSVWLMVVVFSPAYAPAISPLGGTQFQTTPDQVYEFRTGFPVQVMVHVERSHVGSDLIIRHMSALPDSLLPTFNATSGELMLHWDKPCVGHAVEGVFCFMAMELPHALNASVQACLRLHILEDQGPAFAREVAFMDAEEGASLEWMMGRERAFAVMVTDAAVMDRVASLELASNTSLPMGAVLEPAVLQGNTGHRVFRWMPLMTAGGGTYQLCFTAADTPGVTYEQCRLGARTSMMCVSIRVTACKYAVRPQESMNDVAALFNTDWVQLWALNPAIHSPDSEVGFNHNLTAKGAVVNAGHMYAVGSGDYVAAVAYKFGTTVKHLVNLNAQLAAMPEDAPLQEGSHLCVIPRSCLRD